jgi:hypothetical protein
MTYKAGVLVGHLHKLGLTWVRDWLKAWHLAILEHLLASLDWLEAFEDTP